MLVDWRDMNDHTKQLVLLPQIDLVYLILSKAKYFASNDIII